MSTDVKLGVISTINYNASIVAGGGGGGGHYYNETA